MSLPLPRGDPQGRRGVPQPSHGWEGKWGAACSPSQVGCGVSAGGGYPAPEELLGFWRGEAEAPDKNRVRGSAGVQLCPVLKVALLGGTFPHRHRQCPRPQSSRMPGRHRARVTIPTSPHQQGGISPGRGSGRCTPSSPPTAKPWTGSGARKWGRGVKLEGNEDPDPDWEKAETPWSLGRQGQSREVVSHTRGDTKSDCHLQFPHCGQARGTQGCLAASG